MTDAAHDQDPDRILNSGAAGRLSSLVERLERLHEDKQAVMDDMKEVFAEAKGEGWDVKTLRWALAERRLDKAKRQERDAIRDLYACNLDLV